MNRALQLVPAFWLDHRLSLLLKSQEMPWGAGACKVYALPPWLLAGVPGSGKSRPAAPNSEGRFANSPQSRRTCYLSSVTALLSRFAYALGLRPHAPTVKVGKVQSAVEGPQQPHSAGKIKPFASQSQQISSSPPAPQFSFPFGLGIRAAAGIPPCVGPSPPLRKILRDVKPPIHPRSS